MNYAQLKRGDVKSNIRETIINIIFGIFNDQSDQYLKIMVRLAPGQHMYISTVRCQPSIITIIL